RLDRGLHRARRRGDRRGVFLREGRHAHRDHRLTARPGARVLGLRPARAARPRRSMPRQHWLMKSEPFKYPFAQLVKDGQTMWDGVRNYEARNNLRAMKAGDLVLFYHSNDGKAVAGVARVKREAYPDPTAEDEDWSVVDIEPISPL